LSSGLIQRAGATKDDALASQPPALQMMDRLLGAAVEKKAFGPKRKKQCPFHSPRPRSALGMAQNAGNSVPSCKSQVPQVPILSVNLWAKWKVFVFYVI